MVSTLAPGRGGSLRDLAIRIAVRGFPCEALRGALRELAALDVDLAALGRVDHDDWRGMTPIERTAAGLDEHLQNARRPHDGVLRGMAARVRSLGEKLDGQPAASTGEMLWQALLTQLVETLAGQPIVDDWDAVGTAFGMPAGPSLTVLDNARRLPDVAGRIIERAPLAHLVAWLVATRALLAMEPSFAVPPEDLDAAAAVIAPYLASAVVLGFVPALTEALPAQAAGLLLLATGET